MTAAFALGPIFPGDYLTVTNSVPPVWDSRGFTASAARERNGK